MTLVQDLLNVIEQAEIQTSGAIFDGKSVKYVSLKGHGRCTNFSLEAFDVSSDKCIFGTSGNIEVLRDAGFELVDIERIIPGSVAFRASFRSKDGTSWKYNEKTLVKSFYAKFKPNMSISKFIKTFPKGKFLIGTPGHSMSVIDGVLWDYSGKGPDRRRIVMAHQVMTKNEYKRFKDKYIISV